MPNQSFKNSWPVNVRVKSNNSQTKVKRNNTMIPQASTIYKQLKLHHLIESSRERWCDGCRLGWKEFATRRSIGSSSLTSKWRQQNVELALTLYRYQLSLVWIFAQKFFGRQSAKCGRDHGDTVSHGKRVRKQSHSMNSAYKMECWCLWVDRSLDKTGFCSFFDDEVTLS